MLNQKLLNGVKPVDYSAIAEDKDKAAAILKAVGETLLWVALAVGIGIYLCFYFIWLVLTSFTDGEH